MLINSTVCFNSQWREAKGNIFLQLIGLSMAKQSLLWNSIRNQSLRWK